MKLLCVSDQIDPAVYSVNAKDRFNGIDGILCAGDLPMDYIDFMVSVLNKPAFFVFGNHNLNDFFFYHKKKNILESSSCTCDVNTISKYHGAEYLGFRLCAAKDLPVTDTKTGGKRPLLIAGISGSRRYNNGLNQYTERQMKFKMLCFLPRLILNKLRYGCYLDILLTHASPRHIHDKEDPCHKGFKCFNWFIKKFKPKWLVHGHIHLYDLREERVTICGDTTVVNAFGYYVIELL